MDFFVPSCWSAPNTISCRVGTRNQNPHTFGSDDIAALVYDPLLHTATCEKSLQGSPMLSRFPDPTVDGKDLIDGLDLVAIFLHSFDSTMCYNRKLIYLSC